MPNHISLRDFMKRYGIFTPNERDDGVEGKQHTPQIQNFEKLSNRNSQVELRHQTRIYS